MASPRLPLFSSPPLAPRRRGSGLTTTTTTTSRYEAVARGAVFEARSWLSADLTSRLRADAASLLADGAFRSSGLSNTARGEQGDQGFGANDRSVLAVTPELGGDVSARAEFQLLIDELRVERVQSCSACSCAEQYSQWSAGASLPSTRTSGTRRPARARPTGSPYRRRQPSPSPSPHPHHHPRPTPPQPEPEP